MGTRQGSVLCAGLLAAACLATLPLLTHDTIPRGDDTGEHVQFAQDFSAGLAEGRVYPRWLGHANRGFGAPAFIFYPPLATALVAVLHVGGLPLFSALRLAIFLLTLGAAATAAWFGLRLPLSPAHGSAPGRAWRGLLVGSLYVLLPYHTLDIFTRFALAETATFVFLPILFLAWERTAGNRVLAAAVAYAGLCLSHLPTAYLGGWVAILWTGGRSWKRVAGVTLPLALGLGLAAVYVLPAVWERPLVHSEWLEENPVYRFDNHYLFGSGEVVFENDPIHGSRRAQLETLSPVRTSVLVTLALAMAAWATRRWLRRRHAFREPLADPLDRYAVLALACTVAMTRVADPLWRYIPGLASVAFPWRLSTFLTLATAVLVGLTVADLLRAGARLTGAALALAFPLSLALSASVAAQADWTTFTTVHAESETVRLRPAGVFVPKTREVMRGLRFHPPAGEPLVLNEAEETVGEVITLTRENHRRAYQVEVAAAGGVLHVPLFHYPGWTARVDGVPASIAVLPPAGTVLIPLPAGSHQVELIFSATRGRRVAWAVSGLTAAFLVVLTLLGTDRTMRQERRAA